MKPQLIRSLTALIVLLVLTACSGTAASPAPAHELTVAPEPTVAQDPLAVGSRQDVKKAVIQIVSKGTFVPPGETASTSGAGSGSGFIIDPAGIAVTNNHVVTGAALIEVYVGGESEPRNAKVLGVSECSDLAMIDIEGDGYPYLTWYQGEISAGMDVFTAGFPLGDPEFTITKGVVSKEKTSGKTNWASVERVIEHDATIRRGNSGGPLVEDSGQVLAINYASLEGGPYFAIGRDEATRLLEQLREGENVASVGLNGQAIKTDKISGIWVWSVESGSPIDKARVQPGDFITRMEGLEMAADGTMADYCQILRSHEASDVIGIEVVRPETGELLEGQINGRELEAIGRVASGGNDSSPEPTTPPSESMVVPFAPDAADIQAARDSMNNARGQYSELVFETFDRGMRTRRSWEEDASSVLRDNFYRLSVSEASSIRPVFWRPDGAERPLGDSYMIEADVAFETGGAVGGVGLAFEGQGVGNYMTFVIRTDNTWQVIS
ncbi:MAG: trypsin-like serine protease, partial [Chloroflexales bacterium]|nr:trypsin-like serine protease [Chloroflexales bacterium]